MSSSFGTRLRLQRERQQVSLHGIAAETKIKLSLLEGLERDDISYWPQGIFRRAYIRAYARAIGLEPDAVVREFVELYPDSVEVLPAGTVAWPDRGGEAGGAQPATRLRRLVTSAMAAVPTFLQGVQGGEAVAPPPPSGAVRIPPVEDEPLSLDGEPSIDAADDLRVTPEPRSQPPLAEARGDEPAARESGPADDEPERPDAIPEQPRSSAHGAEPAVASVAARDDAPGENEEPARAEPDLAAAARLCTRLAQARDRDEVAALLEGAAATLDAAGLIVWSWDARADALQPVFAYGYTDAVLARIRVVPVDAANAVAAAFRSSDTCVVEGAGGLLGAVVVPLMAPGGCVGVLALELRHGGERRESVRAFAAIVAAQMAALFGSAPLSHAASG